MPLPDAGPPPIMLAPTARSNKPLPVFSLIVLPLVVFPLVDVLLGVPLLDGLPLGELPLEHPV